MRNGWYLFGQAMAVALIAGCNCDRGNRGGYYAAPAPTYSTAPSYSGGTPMDSSGGSTYAAEAEPAPRAMPPAAGSGSRTAPMFQGSGSR